MGNKGSKGVQYDGEPLAATEAPSGNKPKIGPIRAPEYSASELVYAARDRFGAPPEVVGAALKVAGVEKTTIEKAERIIKAFLERAVK